jgi:hypothetical protein
VTLLLVGGATILLHLCRSRAIASPALTEPGAWPGWLAAHRPEAVITGVLRVMALGACWYLVTVTLIGVFTRLVGWRPLVRVFDHVTIPAVRTLVRWTMGVGMLTTAMVRTEPAGAVNAPPPTLIMTRLPDGTRATTTAAEPLPAVPRAPVPRAATWTVRPGDSFWSIARDCTALASGREPDEPEIVAYWQKLIDANRSALADPANVDLIFAGQVFRLPPFAQS